MKTHLELEGTLDDGRIITVQADVEFNRRATRRDVKEYIRRRIEREDGVKIVDIRIIREGSQS